MISFEQCQGAIFDLDDTLLSNGPADKPAEWLHSRSRLAAIHEIANQYTELDSLKSLTLEENSKAFVTASEHSLLGAIWNVFYMHQLTPNNLVDNDSDLFSVAQQIAARKNELHGSILQEFGKEVPGASDFIRQLAANGLNQRLALATAAVRSDINIFLDKYSLQTYFPDERIISIEKVTKPKPDPECFDLAFLALGLPESARANVWAFEDNPRGIASAKGAGLFVCAITTMFGRDDPLLLRAKPDLIADSYDDFRSILRIPI